jgi:hypothetical protein
MSERYEMGSAQWLAALHAFMAAARPQLDFSRDFTMCEVYRNVPGHVAGGKDTVAFTVRFRKDSEDVGFELSEAAHADFKLTIDYECVLPLGHLAVEGNPEKQAEMQRRIADAVSSGRARIEGAPDEAMLNAPVHDQIARLTA